MELLSEEQRSNTEQRILHDAQLLREGATINELGQLVITEAQYADLANFNDETYREAREAWLSSPIMELPEMSLNGGPGVTRIITIFEREGITSRRDILLTGKEKLVRFRNMGAASMSRIEAILENDFAITLQVRPQMTDIVALCEDLAQINSIVLGNQAVIAYFVDSHSLERNTISLSIQDIINEVNQDGPISKQMSEYFKGYYGPMNQHNYHELAVQVQNHMTKAREFAQAFAIAKADVG